MKPTILLITGSGGDAQGWGNMAVTEAVKAAIETNGWNCEIVSVERESELRQALAKHPCTLAWSALYFFSERADIIGQNADAVWIADILDELGVPYIGPSAKTMKALIGKFTTHEILAAAGVRVPKHWLIPPESPDAVDVFPAFVKPNGESRSVGINENSVAETPDALKKQIEFIHRELGQEALVEEYLPGEEYTVMVIGNGARQEILPGRVTVPPECYGKYPVLRSDLRGVGLTHVSIPERHVEEAKNLADAACKALNCSDHIRIDMKVGADGKLRIMEVNGIPGLKPVKSWSPQIYALYHPDAEPYSALIGTIVRSALERINS